MSFLWLTDTTGTINAFAEMDKSKIFKHHKKLCSCHME